MSTVCCMHLVTQRTPAAHTKLTAPATSACFPPGGGHGNTNIYTALKSYLQLEWERKRHEGEMAAAAAAAAAAAGGGATVAVAADGGEAASGGGDAPPAGDADAAAAPGGTAAAAAAAGGRAGAGGQPHSVPYAWALAHPAMPPLVISGRPMLPFTRVDSLPTQVGFNWTSD
jgi:hypothetical protein